MWINRKDFNAVKDLSEKLINLVNLQEHHIKLAHQEILRLNKEIIRLKAVKPDLRVVQNDRT